MVALVHSLAADGGMWAEQVPALLDAGFQVLRIDIRGHGGSQAAPGPYSVAELTEDIAAVIEALSVDGVHLVGLSIGGVIAQAMAIRHADRLKSATICDSFPASAPNAKEVWEPRIASVRAAGSLQPVADATIERWLTPHFKEAHRARWQQIYNTIGATDVEGYAGCAAALQQFDLVPDLPSVGCPALIICGADDPGAPPATNRKIASLIAGARYEEISDALHLPNVEKPDAFNRILLGWLSGFERSAA